MRKRPDSERRKFLGGLLTGLAGAGVLRPPEALTADPDAVPGPGGYRRTPHVDSYYRTLQD